MRHRRLLQLLRHALEVVPQQKDPAPVGQISAFGLSKKSRSRSSTNTGISVTVPGDPSKLRVIRLTKRPKRRSILIILLCSKDNTAEFM
jgi:hypothetical protein